MHLLVLMFLQTIFFLSVTTLITLAIPMRRLPLRFVWLAMLFVIYMLYPVASERSSYIGLGLAEFFTLTVLISLAAATVIKLVWRAIRRRSVALTPNADMGSDPRTSSLDVPLIATGAFVGLTVVYAAFMLGAVIRPTWIAPALIVGVSVGVLALWVLAMWFGAVASVRQFAASLGCSAVIVSIGTLLWISHSIDNVIARAEAAAGDKPYCVQFQGRQHPYGTAASKLDFSPQTMRAVCGQIMCFDHHAVLVIADGATTSLSHWSYGSNDFVPGVLNSNSSPVKAACQPRQHFAQGLPLL